MEEEKVKHLGTATIEIESKGLILRKFEMTDAKNMFSNWANDVEVSKFFMWEPHKSIDVTKEIIESWIREYESEKTYNWAIVLKENEEVIGSITVISMLEAHESCELGYCLSRKHWKKGIMTEAVKSVNNFLFKDVGFHRIQAHHDTENPASGRVMEKAGMKYEGTLRHRRIRKDGTRADGKIWAIISSDVDLG